MILNKDISPSAIKTLSLEDLRRLCSEIRRFLVKSVSVTGGHLASNLGTVELTVALHKVYDSPSDKIVFDVGHQSYTHKLITGRFGRFSELRRKDGISGFPRQSESEHDAFIGGHSGISVSAALGLAEAARFSNNTTNNTKHKTIAVVGDGAFTDGGTFEGMNNAGKSKANILVILNDNGMSISKNTGAFAAYLTSLRSNRKYYKAKLDIKHFLEQNKAGEAVSEAVSATKKFIKNTIYNQNNHSNFFENLGFKYYGIVDGHNLAELTEILELAKMIEEPCLIHVKTKKGKGYRPAERNSGEYHGVSNGLDNVDNEKITYSEVFGREIAQLAEVDKKIVLISAAMKYATGCNYFNDRFPERFYDSGIAEGHSVTFAAGLAAGGMLPVFAVYSTFLQRGFDRLIHDCAIEKQRIVLAIDRAGAVGEDGETHQGVFDVAMLSMIPSVTIFSPANAEELRLCLRKALYECEGIAAVRYPKGEAAMSESDGDCDYVMRGAGSRRLNVSYGRIADRLPPNSDLLRLIKIKPVSEEAINAALWYNEIVFYEEGSQRGGIGEAFLFELIQRGYKGGYSIRAFNDFIAADNVEGQLKILGI